MTDRHAIGDRELTEVTADLIQCGLRGLQIREKDMPDTAYRVLVEKIMRQKENMPVRVFLNSRVSLAAKIAVGLHLPDGSDVAAARRQLGAEASIGVSCHSSESARRAQQNGASFVMFGPIFTPVSKTPTGPPLGLSALEEVAKAVTVPVVAIGGITPKNAPSCLAVGAQAVAAIGSLLGARDVRSTLVDFMRALGRL